MMEKGFLAIFLTIAVLTSFVFADTVADPKEIAEKAKNLKKNPPTEQTLGIAIYPGAKLDAESSADQTLVRKKYWEVYVYKVKDSLDNVINFYSKYGKVKKRSDGANISLENGDAININSDYKGIAEEIAIWKRLKK